MKRIQEQFDAIVIGSGPNGLAAAITFAESGWRVLLLEALDSLGGGMRTQELTLPGFRHDVCSAVHPMAVASPFFQSQPLENFALEWRFPDVPLAHPFADGTAVAAFRGVEETARQLGEDSHSYRSLFRYSVEAAPALMRDVLGPLRWPRHPLLMSRFGSSALRSADSLVRGRFRNGQTRALFAGASAHSTLPLTAPVSAGFGLMLLITAHAFGWPVAKGGSQAIAAALADRFCSLGGTVQTGVRVRSARDLPRARVVVFDTSPRALAEIAGEALPAEFASKLAAYRHGPAAFKVDFALSGAIPWTAPLCRRAGTVHVGGELEEIVASEAAAWSGKIAPRPFVLVAQQSLFDPTRAPASSHTAWAYCHVPNASEADASHAIESQIERFAPGFRSLVLARHITRPKDFAAYNANYVGGDITGGVQDWSQLFARPTLRLCPYSTPNRRIYLCSASTPPGGGVHGMCGYHAARAAMNRSAGLPHGRL